MTFEVSEVSAHDAYIKIARGLGGAFGELPFQQSLAADHIRSILYGSAKYASEHNASAAVHTSRLLTSVRKTLDLLRSAASMERLVGDTNDQDVAQQTLAKLADFGDVVDTGGGYWVGTPHRLVCGGDTLLGLGAAPNAVFKALLKTSPLCAGIARLAENRTRKYTDLALSVVEWLGPVENIVTWTKAILDQHERGMRSGNDVSADQLEVFAPDRLSARQRNPWVSAQAIGEPGPGARLCRPTKSVAFVWDRPFYLSHFQLSRGGLVVSKSVRVEYSITRRLRFGLKNLYGRAETILATTSGDLVDLELPLALPDPEVKIQALGWPLASNPRRTVFHRLAIPLLTEMLERLAVRVIVR